MKFFPDSKYLNVKGWYIQILFQILHIKSVWSLVRDFSEHDVIFARYVEYGKTNVSDDLLFSLLRYDEVSGGFPAFGEARNSSLLAGRPISLFLNCSLLRLRKLRGHVYLACASMKRNGRTCLFDKLIFAVVNEFAAEFESFVLLSLEKYQQFSHMGPWSATFGPREVTFRKAGEENLR